MSDHEDDRMSIIHSHDSMGDEDFPPLPPPHSPGGGGGGAQSLEDPFGDAEEGEVSKLADVPAAKRKVVKRPQPKLDSQRLISDRGLPALRTLFDNVRFKGKGHEAEDLRLLMHKMENWAHRLYPKLQFEDFIDRVEKLGSKKEVQTCLKRIRLDMPLTNEDFMESGGMEEPPTDGPGFQDPDPFYSQTPFNNPPEPIHSTPAPVALTPPSLTEEQRLRMELNRQRALERRLARQQQQLPDSQAATAPSPGSDPGSVPAAHVHNGFAEDEKKMEDLDHPVLPPTDTEPSEGSAESSQGEKESSSHPEAPLLSGSTEEEQRQTPPSEAPAEPQPPSEAPAEPQPPSEAPAEPQPPSEAPAEPQPPSEAAAEPQPPSEAAAEPQPPSEAPAEPQPPTEAPAEPQPPSEAPAEPRPPSEAPAEPRPPSEFPAEPRPPSETPAQVPTVSDQGGIGTRGSAEQNEKMQDTDLDPALGR
ncbi:TIMELESS-interacting protein [Cyprinodon tularosa]|uniref:TIMELESS-interacting protein n=1 Tax=Cyprinodon tularosa TaxID=77115 RepID=UPI0018E215FC|nr:TIMELESS-interacting protein [Cyprinodon tularosa]